MHILGIMGLLLLISVMSSTSKGRAEMEPKVEKFADYVAKPFLVFVIVFFAGIYLVDWLGKK